MNVKMHLYKEMFSFHIKAGILSPSESNEMIEHINR